MDNLNEVEVYAKGTIAASGGLLSYMFGGWPMLLQILFILVVIDYLTGFMAAGSKGELKSSVGYIGIARKIFIFCVVTVAHQMDTLLGNSHLLRDTTIFFYLANELLSIVENGGRLNVPIPSIIKKSVEVLKNKGGDSDEKDHSSDR